MQEKGSGIVPDVRQVCFIAVLGHKEILLK